MLITADQLCSIMPNLSRSQAAIFSPLLTAACAEFELIQPEVLAMFLAQVAHESSELSRVVENLNYSAVGLIKTWPKRFTPHTAVIMANRPELIANHVYGGRMGNVGVYDGYRYRGGGLIQLTGRANYELMGRLLGLDLVSNPSLLQNPTVAARSAAAFFAKVAVYHGRTAVRWAQLCDLAGSTQAINGGLNGLSDRRKYYARACQAFSLDVTV